MENIQTNNTSRSSLPGQIYIYIQKQRRERINKRWNLESMIEYSILHKILHPQIKKS